MPLTRDQEISELIRVNELLVKKIHDLEDVIRKLKKDIEDLKGKK